MATQITATLPSLDFPKEVDYPTQEDWAAFSAAAELNFGILGGSWSAQMQLWKTEANAMSTELNTNATIAQGLANYQGDWTSKGYTLGQTVSVSGIYYICKLTHTTGQNPTAVGSLYWNLALGNWSLVATKQYVDEIRIGLIDYGYVAKAYHIVAFGGEFNRADYPKLWAYLQANPTLVKTQAQWTTESTANGGICGFYSSGNGTTTFRVPNLDKAFLRPDNRGVGSYQVDMFKSHTHSWGLNNQNVIQAGAGAPGWGSSFRETSTEGGAETRPKNIAVLPLIVAK